MAETAETFQIAEVPRPLLTARTTPRGGGSASRALGRVGPVPVSAPDKQPNLPVPTWFDIAAYQRDLWERSILFLDALRQRADDLIAYPVPETAPLKMFEQAAFDTVRDALNQYRNARDKALERAFDWLYGSGVEHASHRPAQ